LDDPFACCRVGQHEANDCLLRQAEPWIWLQRLIQRAVEEKPIQVGYIPANSCRQQVAAQGHFGAGVGQLFGSVRHGFFPHMVQMDHIWL
jgi:hypothetical protein